MLNYMTMTHFAEGSVEHCFPVSDTATCDGTSLWMESKGMKFNVDAITIRHLALADRIVTEVLVAHDGPWEVYTDRGFEQDVSRIVGFPVKFTEQGMQELGIASLEPAK